ncbi:MAG TPA: hypothetical protein VK766_08710 [Cytophagaceae bacterium]|jgi:hypothetical protein|nr:hypothetical protein [Cytophagaceae bacterium]
MHLFTVLVFNLLSFNGSPAGNYEADTLIDGLRYEIITRYRNGAIRKIGQFSPDCIGHKHTRLGRFITYNPKGKAVRWRYYFYNRPWNIKVMGVKFGWWGFFPLQDYYIFSVAIHHRIIDPCIF